MFFLFGRAMVDALPSFSQESSPVATHTRKVKVRLLGTNLDADVVIILQTLHETNSCSFIMSLKLTLFFATLKPQTETHTF